MKQPSKPPEPPPVKRAGLVYPAHVIGVTLLALLPVLALLGIFGEEVNTASASTPGLLVEVRHITRTRYSLRTTMEIVVENRTSATLSDVMVSLDREYLDGFTSAQFKPDVTRVTPETIDITLPDLEPGAWRAIDIQMTANRVGTQSGHITVRAESANAEGAATLTIETLVLP
ncbi:MAG: hypothetical protein IT323_06025 [Anaerolineae bacterium]|nr:hypothetical protein [Anaerolineae bacterium]